MSNQVSRREALVVLTAAGTVVPAVAQHAHEALAAAKSLNQGPNYKPKALVKHQFDTLKALGDLILPADATSPAASEAGAAEFIDYLCSKNEELNNIFTGGLFWMDNYMQSKYNTTFLQAKKAEQIALLDNIAYRKLSSPEFAPGQKFFVWARNMVMDAYYTSPVGFKDLGFMGNGAMAEFSVPKEAVAYVMKRSPFANEA